MDLPAGYTTTSGGAGANDGAATGSGAGVGTDEGSGTGDWNWRDMLQIGSENSAIGAEEASSSATPD